MKIFSLSIDQIQNCENEADFKHNTFDKKSIRGLCKHFKSFFALTVFCLLFIFFVTCSVYSLTGNPGVKSYFFSELMGRDPKTLNGHERLVRLQALFFRMPHDGKIADALAVGYLEEGRFQEAVNTYLDALQLNGETAPRLVGYGLALVGYEGGMITQEAQDVFQKAVNLAPNDFYPHLLLANAFHQAGQSSQAVQLLQNFLSKRPKDIKGRSRVEEMIIQLLDVFKE
ncbi:MULTISPECIES: tetratricopeptide repeat protein [unclassified Bartonella]|uniref:tetratricopeptide repeat protein n=1 Tax=unclassified Bartonella TaxID=2645622 RepID=UPI0009C28703|nr:MULTISPECIES: tetratricopeptide repeat protein [unclassified Bartonella]AQX27659.1 cytochrome c-type biogenesis protein CcmH [Bartonella sp. JB15]AQX28940.1 cytochrome c-type biogenesis protein CcmH [Bartonella sp. JB63]